MSVATFAKYLLKALAISCGSVKHWPLSIILDGATLATLSKRLDSLYLPIYSSSHLCCFGRICEIRLSIFFH